MFQGVEFSTLTVWVVFFSACRRLFLFGKLALVCLSRVFMWVCKRVGSVQSFVAVCLAEKLAVTVATKIVKLLGCLPYPSVPQSVCVRVFLAIFSAENLHKNRITLNIHFAKRSAWKRAPRGLGPLDCAFVSRLPMWVFCWLEKWVAGVGYSCASLCKRFEVHGGLRKLN